MFLLGHPEEVLPLAGCLCSAFPSHSSDMMSHDENSNHSISPQTVSKYNSQYHKLFQTVPKEEILMKGDQQGAPPWGARLYCTLKNRFPSLHVRPASSSAVYSCALLRDILLQGRLYISRNWLCFYANLFGKDIKVSDALRLSLPPRSPTRPIFSLLRFSQDCSGLITWCRISRNFKFSKLQSDWTNHTWGCEATLRAGKSTARLLRRLLNF